MSEDIKMITYPQVLQELKSTDQCSHLLLGNGFNNSLGICTNYRNIFEKMVEEDFIYKTVKSTIETIDYDIEKLIGSLKECINTDSSFNSFLKSYVENKVKFDFMKSACLIVRDKIKGIYQDRNEKIYLLFKNFTTYLTLNYDTFLYLILMKFKRNRVLAFQNSSLFQSRDLDEIENRIYAEIKGALENGQITTQVNNETLNTCLNKLPKTTFESIIKNYNKQNNKQWKSKDIRRICNRIWEEKNNKPILEINDGFQDELFNNNYSQNVFFLHGSFHLYKDKTIIKKITQKQNEAVYERLEEIINTNEEEIICVFTNKSEDKMKQIQDNQYLSKCFDKLSNLSGNLVILGASLDENDRHIFSAVNNSNVCRLYISSSVSSKCEFSRRASQFFPSKEITLFDYRTISYN
ncbi:DUF4917 family protein [Candidatus Synechococcus spongiarum]|uniref:DUF4917 family protein n=1 Tax=Candidatus Synechococcus spongiarum TaxID=431041 RepID=UPI0015D66314|nr:DUF4917 family protein [Candidatus Synechococcus spongiarum]